jgi:hypothetical protein
MNDYKKVLSVYEIKNTAKLYTPLVDIYDLRPRQKDTLKEYSLKTAGDYVEWVINGGQVVGGRLRGFSGKSMAELYVGVMRHLGLPVGPFYTLKEEPLDEEKNKSLLDYFPDANVEAFTIPLAQITLLTRDQLVGLQKLNVSTVEHFLTLYTKNPPQQVEVEGFVYGELMNLRAACLTAIGYPTSYTPTQAEKRKEEYSKTLHHLVESLEHSLSLQKYRSVENFVNEIGFGVYLNDDDCLVLCNPSGSLYVNLGNIAAPVAVGRVLGYCPEIGYTLRELIPAVE